MTKKKEIPGSKIDVLLKGGVYSVFTDLMTGHYLPISDASWAPPEDAMPSTYLDEATLRMRFSGHEINIIGEPLKDSDRLAENAPTDEEVMSAADKKDKLKPSLNIPSNFPYSGTVFKPYDKEVSHDTDFELLKLFSSQTYRLTDKRNKGGKDYLNGMAKVILTICPFLKEDLKACLFAKNIKEKDDLL